MSFFEFFSQYNFHWRIYFFEYSELLLGFLCCFFVYKAGRIALSVSITVFALLFKLLFDHYWLYFVHLKQFSEYVLIIWYNGFALSGLLFICCVYHCHRFFKVEFSSCARFLVSMQFGAMFLQISRYWERTAFDTDYLNLIYRYGIPAFNMSGILFLTHGAFLAYKKSKAFSQRIPWGWE